ncbi:DUF4333 domain-containing protein [Corynebacterium jeikeium]|uniref:DUF4333 domain-containing protein n=1 Tax=Corynebacterium jeikeium TaxID=38289 RepID=UPI00055772A7|nr:DUF4333 domain-containing protein [Corynebacterium jeikeium]
MKNTRTSADSARFSKRLGAAFLTGALAVTGLSACSLLGGEVAQEDVEKGISDSLEKEIGRKPERIECPSGLKAEEGAKIECKLHDSGETYSVDVTADKVDGNDVHYNVEVADQPE